jgi:hypothetical protein
MGVAERNVILLWWANEDAYLKLKTKNLQVTCKLHPFTSGLKRSIKIVKHLNHGNQQHFQFSFNLDVADKSFLPLLRNKVNVMLRHMQQF